MIGSEPSRVKKCVGISITRQVQAAPSADKGLGASPDVCSKCQLQVQEAEYLELAHRLSSTKYECK